MNNFYKAFIFAAVCGVSIAPLHSEMYIQGSSNYPQRGQDIQYSQDREDSFNNQRSFDDREPSSFQAQFPQSNPQFNAPDRGTLFQERSFELRNSPNSSEIKQFNETYSSTSPGTLDDSIISQIREKIAQDHYLSQGAKKIQITSQDGYVGLRGTVHSNEEKSRLENLAKNINGVRKVSTSLQIK